jgi:hypothetical protein
VFNEQDPYVQFKLETLRRTTPAQSAIVFGDIYMVDGGYSRKCLDYGCKEVLLIDSLETVQWQKNRIENRPFQGKPGQRRGPLNGVC